MWKASASTCGDLVAATDQEVVFGDRHGDAGDVGLLEGVGADQRAPDLPGDRDDRDRVHLRVGQRRHQVGGAGPGGGHANPDLAGGVRVAAGGVTGTLLVADEYVAQLLGVEERVVDGQHSAAGDAEDHLDVEFLQRPDHRLRAGELLRRNDFALGAGRPLRFRGHRPGGLDRRRAVGLLRPVWRRRRCRVVGALTMSSSSSV